MFGKMMSIPDELMWSYDELVTDRTPQEITGLKQQVESGALHPMDAKMKLAQEVVAGFHGAEAARNAAENFQRVFRERQAPAEMKEIRLSRRPDGFLGTPTQLISASPKWPQLLKYLGQTESISEAARIVEQGGLEVNGKIVRDPMVRLNSSEPGSYVLRVGKRKFLRLVVE
jgi:tyrosyl-tRNA synthetase